MTRNFVPVVVTDCQIFMAMRGSMWSIKAKKASRDLVSSSLLG